MSGDIRDYLPKLSTIMHYTSPEVTAERRRQARENFGRQTPVPQGEGPPITNQPDDEPTRPSPWGQPSATIDKSQLPSAMPPACESTLPTSTAAAEVEPAQVALPRAIPRSWLLVRICILVAILAPVITVLAGTFKSSRSDVSKSHSTAVAPVTSVERATSASDTSPPLSSQTATMTGTVPERSKLLVSPTLAETTRAAPAQDGPRQSSSAHPRELRHDAVGTPAGAPSVSPTGPILNE
jgi:hypothetical protein